MMRRQIPFVLLIPAFLLAMVSTATGEIIYVDADASVGGDGSSWAAAFKFLQDALDDAVSGDEIRVSQGIYTPDSNSDNPTGSGNRETTFQLKNGATVKGGYAGFGETDPNERDIEAYETILSGDLAGDDGPNFANNGENSYHVVTGNDTDETAILDGFTITGGNADSSSSSPDRCGGGIYNVNGSPTLINCAFNSNLATGSNCKGGGMYNGSGSPVLTNCIFSGNLAGTSTSQGGGMYCGSSNDVRLTNCTFIDNRTEGTGGGLCNRSYNMTLINCIFIANSARWNGGGVSSHWPFGYATLTNCIFISNSAGYGGGMSDVHTIQIMTNCTFIGNSAEDYGGGIYNCLENWGGYDEITTLTNCILWGNSANEGPQIALDYHDASISFCDIQGGELDIYLEGAVVLNWGVGNIETDPCFVDFDNGDYHLQWDSQCINAGDPSGDYTDQVDMDGEPRVMAGRVDIGADEVGEKQADFTRDGIINLEDFSVFSRSWMSLPGEMNWYVLCDLYEDEQIGLADLAGLVDDWLWQADWYEP